jgi:hypothetical protein
VVGTGGTFGFIQALAPTITSELFGLNNFATNTAFISTMFIVTSFSIANGMTNLIYKRHTTLGEHHCKGPACFRLTFLLCTLIGIAAALCSAVLTGRRMQHYRRIARCRVPGVQCSQACRCSTMLRPVCLHSQSTRCLYPPCYSLLSLALQWCEDHGAVL